MTQRGRPAGVLLCVDAYQKREQERKILKLFALGEKEIAVGKGYDLDGVLDEVDALSPKREKYGLHQAGGLSFLER